MFGMIKYILGTVKFKVESHNSSRLCGMLMSEFQRAVFDVNVRDDACFEFSTYSVISKKVKRYLSFHNLEYSMSESSGLWSFVKYKIRFPGLVLGLFITVISFILQNRMVWDITVSGNSMIAEEDIITTLECAGFAVGKPYKNEKLSEICNKFIILDDRFSRISINMSGTRAFVEVAERRKKINNKLPISENGLIADKDCIIERPEVFSGTAIVKEGETVEKGALLIIPVEKGTADTEYFTGASGRVYSRVYENFAVFVPFKQISAILTEKLGSDISYSFLGRTLRLCNWFKKADKDFLCTVSHGKLSLYENIQLPIKYKKISRLSYITEQETMSASETENYAYEIMYQKLSEDLADAEILSTCFIKEETNEGIILRCTVECLENIAVIP